MRIKQLKFATGQKFALSVTLRMRTINVQVQLDLTAAQLWASSPTAFHLTMVAETWNQQHLEQGYH